MGSNTPRDRAILLDAAITLFASTTIPAVLYSFSFILYCLSARLSYSQARNLDGKIERKTISTFALASWMMLCTSMDIVLINRYVQTIYVEYSTAPGGPLGLPAQLHASTVGQIDSIVAAIEEILALGVLLWRVWVVWSGTRLAIPVEDRRVLRRSH